MALTHTHVRTVIRWRQRHPYAQNPILTAMAERVTSEFGTEYLTELIADLHATMYAAQGVGLAAPQIGVGLRVAVIDISSSTEATDTGSKLVLINPEITEREGTVTAPEGCLSIPGLTVKVTRAARVTVRSQDTDGNSFERTVEGLMARAVQHECDHLAGELLVHRLSSVRRGLIENRIGKLRARGQW